MNEATAVPMELLDRVVDYFHPRRVILFGSQATGRAQPGSDFDLLVILEHDAPLERLTLRAGWESRQGTALLGSRGRKYQRRGGCRLGASAFHLQQAAEEAPRPSPVVTLGDSAKGGG